MTFEFGSACGCAKQMLTNLVVLVWAPVSRQSLEVEGRSSLFGVRMLFESLFAFRQAPLPSAYKLPSPASHLLREANTTFLRKSNRTWLDHVAVMTELSLEKRYSLISAASDGLY